MELIQMLKKDHITVFQKLQKILNEGETSIAIRLSALEYNEKAILDDFLVLQGLEWNQEPYILVAQPAGYKELMIIFNSYKLQTLIADYLRIGNQH